MAFWGVEVKPGKPHTHVHDSSRGALCISQATLGNGTATKRSVVQCNVGNKSPVLLCSLLPDKMESCCLDLHFEEEDEVVFSVVGPRSVHLTGYFFAESNHGGGNADDSDSYGEDIWEMGSDQSGSYSSEDDYESDFIDDGDVGMTPSPRPNSGVVIEEIIEDEKPSNRDTNGQCLEYKPQDNGSEVGDAGSERRIFVKHDRSPILESEDEDGFPISFSKNSGKNIDGDRKLDGKTSDADRKRKHDVIIDKGSEKSKKKKKDKVKSAKSFEIDNTSAEDHRKDADDESNMVLPCKGECENLDHVDHSHEMTVIEHVELKKKKKGLEDEAIKNDELARGENSEEEALVKSKQEGLSDKQDTIGSSISCATPDSGKLKRKKNKKTAKDGNPLDNKNKSAGVLGKDGHINSNGMEVNDSELSKSQEKMDEDQPVGELPHNTAGSTVLDALHEVKKKQKKNKKMRENDSALDKKSELKNEAPRKPRTFANGLVIDHISMGQPDGKRAAPGKTVSVRYIGKLRNGKIFDSNIGQKPFRFRLGVGQVIKGWDVGLDGMRIGDKRRLTIPPSMGYGEKGAGSVIPGNSWLIFDVELVDVK